jgi:hypothetical protein
VSFASELQSCCQATEACSDEENVDASAWVCADWREVHCFIFGNGAEDSTLCFARMRIDPDKAIRCRLRIDPDEAFKTHGESFVKLLTMAQR